MLTKGDIWFRKEENVLSMGRNLVRRSKMCYRREDIWLRTINGRMFGLEKTNMYSQRKDIGFGRRIRDHKGSLFGLEKTNMC